jgi:hypothetical protein
MGPQMNRLKNTALLCWDPPLTREVLVYYSQTI